MEEIMHNLTMENRERMTITAVDEVVSFNDTEITVKLKSETLHVKGNNLKVENVSKEKGEAEITANKITSITYTKSTGKKEGLLGRMFK